jgi:hypothetical protein
MSLWQDGAADAPSDRDEAGDMVGLEIPELED